MATPRKKVASVETPNEATQARVAHVGERVWLNGTSYDVPHDPLPTYAWALVGPDDSQATLMNPTMPCPSFVPDVLGKYVVALAVVDGVEVLTVQVEEPE